ncbi:DUF3367 domain-containing protein [Candidatus Daviesbacteria bacterium]|nr:DUF3367 domain-containing protein [Candidatus Daviesbacteria bacterium]
MKTLEKVKDILLDPRVFFLLIAFLLVQLWFTKNILFGGTEVGIPTYAPGKILEQIRWLWWEALGPGTSIPTVAASIPFYYFMSILERLGFGAIGIQKVIFFIIIYLQGLGVSLLCKQIIPYGGRLQLLAGLFYIFNPFMMIVWHRFIYANFILSASLPYFVFFYIKLLEKGRMIFIFLFLVISFLASYMFSSVAPVIAIWLAVAVIFIFSVFENRRQVKKITRNIFLTVTLFVLWILTNFWWLYPLFSTTNLVSAFSNKGNVDTLLTLSSQSTINYVIRGINPFIMFFEKDWGEVYLSPYFQLLSWTSVLFILLSFIKREGKVWYMITLFLFGVFMAKGAAEPFGKITAWIYANIYLLGAIRNPFEKTGLLVFLPASILITLGVRNLWIFKIKLNVPFKALIPKIITVILVMGMIVYVWPMFGDRLFGSDKYPPFFTVPADYKEVSAFLSKELTINPGKILILPISEGDAATYNWTYTYNGVELASHLFPGASISRQLYIPFVDRLIEEIARTFHKENYIAQKAILKNLGIKYIVLNKDLDYSQRRIDNPKKIEHFLNTSSDLSIVKETGHLKVYKFLDETKSAVNIAGGISLVSGSGLPRDISQTDYIMGNVINTNNIFLQEFSTQHIDESILYKEILYPQRVIPLESFSTPPDIIIPRPFIKYLPDSIFYPAVILKEKIEFYFTPFYEKSMKMLVLTQKRIIEADRLRQAKKEQEFNRSIAQYSAYLDETTGMLKKLSEEDLDTQTKSIIKVVLDEEKKKLTSFIDAAGNNEINLKIKEDIEKISAFLKDIGLEVYYTFVDTEVENSSKINVYQFFIRNHTRMEFILTSVDSKHFGLEDGKTIKVYLDGTAKYMVLKQEDSKNWFSLGEIELTPGVHEIGLSIQNNLNVLHKVDSNKEGITEYTISDYNPDKTYILSFNYKVLQGPPPQIQFWQDSDKLTGVKVPKLRKEISDNAHDFNWKYLTLSISTNNTASVRLDRSTDKPTIKIFTDNQSKVEIRDLSIAESFNGSVVLSSSVGNTFSPVTAEFKKISPVEYQVQVNNPNQDMFIVLNESFHNGWKVIMDSPKMGEVAEKDHYLTNGYANGWLINRTGELSFRIKFTPQDNLYTGLKISLTVFFLLSLLLLGKQFRRKQLN